MKKIVFIHIPKTGGHSISKALKDIDAFENLNNGDLHRILVDYNNITKEHISCTVIRNPYDRFISLYYWGLRHNVIKQKMDIYIFVKNPIPNTDGRFSYWWKPMVEWIIKDNEKFIKHILNFENLNSDYKKMCETENIPYNSLERLNLNTTKHCPQRKPNKEILTKELQQDIERLWTIDFETFNYKK